MSILKKIKDFLALTKETPFASWKNRFNGWSSSNNAMDSYIRCHRCGYSFPSHKILNIRISSDERAQLQPFCFDCLDIMKIKI